MTSLMWPALRRAMVHFGKVSGSGFMTWAWTGLKGRQHGTLHAVLLCGVQLSFHSPQVATERGDPATLRPGDVPPLPAC